MSNNNKLQQILDYLVNEEHEKAEKLLHEYVVERAANIYETIVAEEDSDGVDDLESDIEESIGGDVKSDFVAEIEADKDDIESDELEDGEPEDVDGDVESDVEVDGEVDFELDGGEGDLEGDAEEGDLEDKIEDLSSQMADLMAEFQSFLGDDDDVMPVDDTESDDAPVSDDELMAGMMYEGDEEGCVSDEDEEALEEATKLQDPVADPGMSQEGKLAGTGKNSKVGSTDKESMYTKAPSKSLNGADPVDFSKGKPEEGSKADKGKDHTPTDNIDVNPKQVGSKETIDQQKKEGEFSGTGKGAKKGAMNTKSPLSTAPKKP
jgi:hypothetical protein